MTEQRANKEKSQKKVVKPVGKSRKTKKFIRENLESLMEMDVKDIKIKNKMLDLGVVDDFTIQNAISCAVVQQALNR